MNVQQLWYFLSAAEHQNFSKAAQDHFISQTAISQQIISLEEQLGFKLFYREHRAVQLTPQGQVFYDEIKVILVKLDQATRKARATGSRHLLGIGFVGLAESSFLPGFIRHFRESSPEVEMTFTQDAPEMIRQGMIDDCIDIVFDLAYPAEPTDSFNWRKIGEDRLCAVIYPGHPLFGRKSLKLSELEGEAFVEIEKKEAPYAYAALQGFFQNCGFKPDIVAHAKLADTLLFLVEARIGIAVLPGSVKNRTSVNLDFIPLEGEEFRMDAVVKWLRSNNNPSIKLFIKSLEDYKSSVIDRFLSSDP
ncbi:MAG: LysR family transcriptional regulator [Clostridiales bacterium]|nr:LysR family transcriptional regulator [Clostridiales bacterium]